MNEHAKHIFDVGSIGTVVATLAGWLPSAAALLTVIWTTIRIIETDTFRRVVRWVRRER